MITFDVLKGGKRACVTMSYDDGCPNDRPLIDIFNRYGIKGTFHINSCRCPENLREVYAGHEIACHGVTHAPLPNLGMSGVWHEIYEDRIALERQAGYPIRGLSYAYGSYTKETLSQLAACGIVYSRTTRATGNFGLPESFLEWHPTTHQNDAIRYGESFMKAVHTRHITPLLLYVWGHSYEFEDTIKWSDMEQFCKTVSGDDEIWYATNIEFYDYIQAQHALVLSADHTMVYNPTAMKVWFVSDGEICSVESGKIWHK